jgi:protein-tyrosine phosphatase
LARVTTSGESAEAVPHVLFVCTANLCRSPIAEHLMRSKLSDRKTEWTVSSAGVSARKGGSLPAATTRVLDEAGISVPEWRTTRLSEAVIRRADLILTATADHRRAVVSLSPAAVARTFTILELARLLTLSELVVPPDPSGDVAGTLIEAAAVGRGRPQSRDAHATDIDDPIGRPLAELRRTAERIGQALDEILSAVAAS